MKKLLIGLSVLLLVSGCGEKKETLTCTSKSTTNGMTTDTKYDIEYEKDKVKYVTITYDYNQDNTNTNNTTDTTTNDDNNTTTNDNNNTTNATENGKTSTNKTDGVDADTDGITKDKDIKTNDNKTESNEVIDGAVGDTIDGAVDGVTNTILDIAGIKKTYENQVSTYKDIKGFSYKVDIDNDGEYKMIYKIDMDKISDSDLSRFNIDRNLNTTKSNYEDAGYTCK